MRNYLLIFMLFTTILFASKQELTVTILPQKYFVQKIVKENYLYSTDHMLITRLTNDAASTIVVSPQSPGRVGAWIGWQIVNQYANKKGFLLEDILSMDAQTILKGAKYNP